MAAPNPATPRLADPPARPDQEEPFADGPGLARALGPLVLGALSASLIWLLVIVLF